MSAISKIRWPFWIQDHPPTNHPLKMAILHIANWPKNLYNAIPSNVVFYKSAPLPRKPKVRELNEKWLNVITVAVSKSHNILE